MTTRSLVAASDFTMVRAALVQELGSVDLAVILTRVAWRCEAQADGWWKANNKQIAKETGLSEDAVQRGLMKLREAGHLVGEQRSGGYDRTMSYSMDVPEVSDVSIPQNCGVDSAELRDVLVSKTTKTPVVDVVTQVETAREDSTTNLERSNSANESQVNRLQYQHTWTPNQAAVDAVFNSARANNLIYPPDEHLDHYLSRMSELKRKPSGAEWMRWFSTDQAKRLAEERKILRGDVPEVDESGTPTTWRKR